MKGEAFSRREFSQTLVKQIAPRVENETALLIPAHPVLAAGATRVTPHSAPLLKAAPRGRAFSMAAHWVEEGFNAARYPTLIWVAEGEADFRLGITRRMAAQNKNLPAKYGFYDVALPAHSFFLVPPGAPISDASRPHWERPDLEKARSRLLWFHVLPAGISLHSCTTKGIDHTSSRALFVSEIRLLPLAESLLEEMQNRAPHHQNLVRHYLSAFVLHLARALELDRSPIEEDFATSAQFRPTGSTPVQRACGFIEAHLSHKITLSQIAAHAYISPSQLNRLFRAELKTTPNEYLTQRRLLRARSLLETTGLPVQRVGVLCGYPNPEHFNRAFRRTYQVSPGAFRKSIQTQIP